MIRAAVPRDRPALERLQVRLPEPTPALLEYALEGPAPLYVSVAGDRPVGYLLALLGETAYVAELVVAPGHRREGRATALLGALFERGRAAGCSEARLLVSAGNAAGRACYRSAGFAVAERIPGYYDDGDALVMRRPL